jgi:nucleoside-diphosphate-sugar epimerase
MVAIAGGHGKIALQLTRRLGARGETVVGLIRKPEHAGDVRAAGGQPVLCDLEHASIPEISSAIAGASAVVFAAGAGPGSDIERKLTVDRDGAIKLLQAAVAADVPRYQMISSVGAENPSDGDDVFSVYLRAKAQADAALRASDREWTIVRPGRLTDEPGTGRVRIDLEPFRGEVPRADVAAVLDVLLKRTSAARRILYVNAGVTDLAQELEALL